MPEDEKKPEDSSKNKLSSIYDELKSKARSGSLYQYTKSNVIDVLAYVVLIIGLFLLFFDSFYGGILIGLVLGRYFSGELFWIIGHLNELIEQEGIVRSLIFGAGLLAFFISAPAIFFGAAAMIILKLFANSDAGPK